MLILIDFPPEGTEGQLQFMPAGFRWLRGELRHYYYYCGGDRRALLVLRNGLRLANLQDGDVLDVSLGYDDGWVGYVRPGDEGMRHTKITVWRRLTASAESVTPLSQIIDQSPGRVLPQSPLASVILK